MKNSMADLRQHLFGTLENLTNPESSEEFEKALKASKAIVQIGTVLVNSAKVELDYFRIADAKGIEVKFFEQKQIPTKSN